MLVLLGLGLKFTPPDGPPDGTTDDLNDGRRTGATNDGPYDDGRFVTCIHGFGTIPILYPISERKRKERKVPYCITVEEVCMC